MSQALSLLALLDMAPAPSPSPDDSDSSHGCSPMAFDPLNMRKPKTTVQLSPLFKLPDDIFKCVLDYLGRDEAWSLKRLCKGMSKSESINQLLYKYPIQLSDVRDLRLVDWKYRPSGQIRWQCFQDSITDENRGYVQKLAITHWASIDDFRWVEANLPALTSLDISSIKDFVWTPEETWTWRMLADACPRLFSRLDELEVANWADYTAHSRIEYSYSYNDYRFKQKFRLSRRRGGGSVAKEIFPLCDKLKTLAIRERYSGFQYVDDWTSFSDLLTDDPSTWNEWEVHQRVCCLVDGIQSNCPSSLTKLKVHDYAPYRSLFSTNATDWAQLTHVEIGLYGWMEDRRERDVIGPIPYRITQGHHHREEEEAFDDKSLRQCKRDHMTLGNHVVQGVGASFEDLLQSLQTISNKYPNITIKPIRNLDSISLHPFHLVNVMHRRQHFGQPNPQTSTTPSADPCSILEVQQAIRWLLDKCDWKPVLAWSSMMCDVFPANLEPNRTFLPKKDVLSRIQTMVSTLRSLSVPIRLSIGDRLNISHTSGLDGSLYFGDYKTLTGPDNAKVETLLPTQAAFNLSAIAHMVDELSITYPFDVPGVGTIGGYMGSRRRASTAEKALMHREMTGWRRFWARYAHQFTNLKKLTTSVPAAIYDDWAKSALPALLGDGRWEMLEAGGDTDAEGPFAWAQLLRFGFHRRKGRVKFVDRVFFREDKAPLSLDNQFANLDPQQREERLIPDSELVDQQHADHRFWVSKVELPETKENDTEDAGQLSKKDKRKAEEDSLKRRVKKIRRELADEINL